MGWERHFVKTKQKQTQAPATSSGIGGNFSSFLPEVYAGNPNRVERYQQYEEMDDDSEISAALDVIADFCTQIEERNERRVLEFRFKDDPTEQEVTILRHTLEKFMTLNELNKSMWYIFRKTLLYGDLFFIRDPETFKLNWVDGKKVQSVFVDNRQGKVPQAYLISDLDLHIQDRLATTTQDQNTIHPFFAGKSMKQSASPFAQPTQGRFSNSPNQTPVDARHVVHISLNVGMDAIWPFGTSILEPVYKTFRQKQLLEDAMVIYRIQRAPERRVFYIDVGDLPANKADVLLQRVKNEIHQRRIPSRNGNGASVSDAVYNPMSIMEDYFFAQTPEGRGSKVEVLPGGEGIANIEDLKYFNNKLIRGLGVPANYISTGPEDSQALYSDGKTGAALQQEAKFTRLCMRIQSIIASALDKEFKHYLVKSGVEIDNSLFELTFNPPQNFAQYAQMERDAALVSSFQQLDAMKYFSKRFIMKRFLCLTDEEIEENIRMWKEENADKVKSKVGVDPHNMEGESPSSMGIRPDEELGDEEPSMDDMMNDESPL